MAAKAASLLEPFHGSFRTACVVKYNYLSLQESQLVHKELEQNKCFVCDFRIFTGGKEVEGRGREAGLCSPHPFVSNVPIIVQLGLQAGCVCVFCFVNVLITRNPFKV